MEHPTFTMPPDLVNEIGGLGTNKSREVRQGMRVWIAMHRELEAAGIDPHRTDLPEIVAYAVGKETVEGGAFDGLEYGQAGDDES